MQVTHPNNKNVTNKVTLTIKKKHKKIGLALTVNYTGVFDIL